MSNSVFSSGVICGHSLYVFVSNPSFRMRSIAKTMSPQSFLLVIRGSFVVFGGGFGEGLLIPCCLEDRIENGICFKVTLGSLMKPEDIGIAG